MTQSAHRCLWLLILQSVGAGALVWTAFIVAGAFLAANPNLLERPLPILSSVFLGAFKTLVAGRPSIIVPAVVTVTHAVACIVFLKGAETDADAMLRSMTASSLTWTCVAFLWALTGSALAMASIPVLSPIK